MKHSVSPEQGPDILRPATSASANRAISLPRFAIFSLIVAANLAPIHAEDVPEPTKPEAEETAGEIGKSPAAAEPASGETVETVETVEKQKGATGNAILPPSEGEAMKEGFGDEGFGDEGFGDEGFGEEGFGAEEFGEESFGGGELPPDTDIFAEFEPEEEDEKESKTIYANAAEAHISFLDLLESEKRFPSASACAACHPDHFREWSVSAHAYAQVSPVFNAMQATLFKATSGTNGDFCIRCHTQVGMQREEPILTSNFNRHPASLEGITCVVCHRIDKNYGKVSGRTSVVTGDVFDPVYGPKGNAILKEILENDTTLKTEEEGTGQRKIHNDAKKFDPIATSGFCGTCHDVNLLNGFRLEEAFTQFKNSPANADGETCQDCHMGKVPGAKVADGEANYHTGPAARIGGDLWATDPEDDGYGKATPSRKRTNHMFAGPDYSIIHPGIFPHSKNIRDQLWDMQNQELKPNGDVVVKERASLRHVIHFKWEDGWGDVNSDFEKRVAKNPKIGEALPWPWNDLKYRTDFRSSLNQQFRLLNEINTQRYQVLRRGYQLGEFKVTRNDHKALEFQVEVRNGTDGHGVPTGFDAERLVFLNVAVKDRYGRKVFESGDRDPNGDVRDLHSVFVHHNADKTHSFLASSDWKAKAQLPLLAEDKKWKVDNQLFSLQSKFIVRNRFGGEREQVLAVNYSVDPLPYIRPDTFPGILRARPGGARKHAVGLPPNGSRIADYKVPAKMLTGTGPYTVDIRFITQMIPVNLIPEISGVGFDYNLSPMEVAKRVVHGHRISPSTRDSDRRGGAQVLWEKTIRLDGERTSWNLHPTEKDIMAVPPGPFPYNPEFDAGQQQETAIIDIVEPPLPLDEQIDPNYNPDDFKEEDFGGEDFSEGEFGEENFGE
ncbi:multiheme c-type cytochrome [Luteolibacter algae]|uniref:Multiheme c-type cytochrome n=1 Tax=Luteolibacter algae TaxID=454151 RepID=A0ABW5D5F7_9BACT